MSYSEKRDSELSNPLLIEPNRPFPSTIAIIGSGTIGPDIGYFLKSSLVNIKLYLVDVNEQALISANKRIEAYADKGIKYNKISSDIAENIKDNIIYTTKYEDIVNCELIIEAATENILLKKDIFTKLESLVSEDAIITSNTSSLPGKRIFNEMTNCSRTAITHFFAPAWRSLPVEVVGWEKTCPTTVDFLRWLFASLGKVPISADDSICFMLDRIFDNWCNEAAYLLSEASASQIDKIAEEFVHTGPFFVLNMAKGNSIIVETNSLQMEEGSHYRPAKIFNSVSRWLVRKLDGNKDISADIRNTVRDRLLGVLFSQSFDIIDRNIGKLSDLNLGCEVAFGFLKGPMDLMKSVGQKETKRIVEKFDKERPGFPKPLHSFGYYQKFRRFVLEDNVENVIVITIRRPQAMNALNDVVTNEILSIFQKYVKNPFVDGFVITGYGKNSFSAGADIGKFPEMLGDFDASVEYARECAKVQRFMDKMDKPVVAAISGFALGGGLEIAIRCHGIVADEKASFQFPEVSLGILPGIGGCIVPYRKWPQSSHIFDEMILSSKKIRADEAYDIGMIDFVVKNESPVKRAIKMVRSFEGKVDVFDDKKCALIRKTPKIPNTVEIDRLNLSHETLLIIAETIKLGISKGSLSDALEIGYNGFGRVSCTDSAREGISAFMERRLPVFKNRDN